ncbi:MAG TPA: dihydroorotate dehydrogenase electron transfer subunit [Candidatus Nitrosopolaris sp.]
MPTNIDRLRTRFIEYIINETPTVRTLIFRDKQAARAKPGQFLMVWIPGKEELPMSAMVVQGKEDYAAVTIRKYGFGSTSLYEKETGEYLGVRGPYGNEFKISKNSENVLLIGGGTGLVPLMRLLRELNNAKIACTFLIGAKSQEEVFFENTAETFLDRVDHKVIVSTDDGSYGRKGYTTDIMTDLIKTETFDAVYTCGPEIMMKKVLDIASARSIPVQASVERHMKCGIGICASCCIADQLVCKDGTIFEGNQLQSMVEFGVSYKDKAGRRMKF